MGDGEASGVGVPPAHALGKFPPPCVVLRCMLAVSWSEGCYSRDHNTGPRVLMGRLVCARCVVRVALAKRIQKKEIRVF